MRAESLEELKRAFEEWRRKKRYAREPVPEDLLKRAHQVMEVHGLGRVAREVRMARVRLLRGYGRLAESSQRRKGRKPPVPSFSRIEVVAPVGVSGPLAELETPSGLKLRLFAQTPQMLGLVSSLCGVGGGG